MAKQRPDPAVIQQAVRQAHGLMETPRFAEAEQIYRDVLKLSSTNADALHGLAQLYYRQQRPQEALVIYDRLRVMLPRNPAILADRGNALKRLGRTAEALNDYDKALAAAPDHVASLYNRGNALLELGRLEEALASYDQALAVQPALYQAHSNRGTALRRLARFAEALASFETALGFQPNDPEVATNRAAGLYDVGRDQDALAAFKTAEDLAPLSALAHYNMAFALLRQGDFTAGWRSYEARWDTLGFQQQRRGFNAPLWLGQEPIAGRTILLHHEQGFGDTLQFIRYLPQVAALGAKILVEIPKELIELVSDFAGDTTVITRGTALPAFDLHCPLMSLPLAFNTQLGTIPAPVPYISAPAAKTESWRQRIHSVAGPRVGLVWAGRPEHAKDAERSLALAMLDPVLAVDGIRFFGLQKEMRPTDAAALVERPQIVPLGGDLASFADTAAAIAALDLIITVDTSVAHLAGAMGKPVWILLPHAPDFRWLTDRDDSPWYSTARLFRQTKANDWPRVIARIAEELSKPDLFPAA